MTSKQWKYKVVKVARGGNGKWFDFPTASTFDTEADAKQYAERFAADQRGVAGAKITVRKRNGDTVATFPVQE